MKALTLFAATFAFVSLKAAQNLNVVHSRYALVPLFGLLLALTEVYVIASVAARGPTPDAVLPVAAGGTLGCWAAMAINDRTRRNG